MNTQDSGYVQLLQIESTIIPLIFLYGLIILMMFGIYAWLKVNLEKDHNLDVDYSEEEQQLIEKPVISKEKALDYSISLATIYAVFSVGFIAGIVFVSVFYPETSFFIPFSIICAVFGVILIFLARSFLFRK